MSEENSTADTNSQAQNAGGDASTAAGATGSTGAADTTVLGGKPAEGEAAKDGENKDDKGTVPEKYEFKLPDGVTLDEGRAAEFSTVAKGLGLSQEQAQKLVDLDVKRAQDQANAHAETVKGWANELKADKEYGGDNLTATLASCKQVMDKFASPALREYMDATGLGNHPELVRFVARIGKGLSEDTFVKGGTTTTPADPAKVMYPNSNMK